MVICREVTGCQPRDSSLQTVVENTKFIIVLVWIIKWVAVFLALRLPKVFRRRWVLELVMDALLNNDLLPLEAFDVNILSGFSLL